MNIEDLKIANQAMLGVVKTGNSLTRIGDQFFKPYKVTATQYNVLVILKYADKKMNQRELSSQLVVSRSDITGIIDRLEKLGYVERENGSDDRRIKLLNITHKGIDLIKRVEKEYFQKLAEITRNLSISDLKKLHSLINKIDETVSRSKR